jgi:tRNA(Ile)-lysidine synthase TilS/MesJ
MIKEGDRIAVGVSGGKDSLVLLAGLNELRKFYPTKFSIVAITLHMGFNGTDLSLIEQYCSENGIEYIIKYSEIGTVVFDIRNEKNPCSLCSKMRRGSLHDAALENGCKKVALGHNFDDAVETLFLNIFYEGRLGCFSPVSYLDRKDITVIRPLIYMPERDVLSASRRLKLPVTPSLCPANEKTKREYIKNLLFDLEKTNKGLRQNIFNAMCKGNLDGFKVTKSFRNKKG